MSGWSTACARKKLGIRVRQPLAETYFGVPEGDEDLSAEEQENVGENLIDEAIAAKTVSEAEIVILKGLEAQAEAVVASGRDRKWDEPSRILQNSSGMPRKICQIEQVFSHAKILEQSDIHQR